MKKRLRHTKNKKPRPPAKTARRDYVYEVKYQLRGFREINEYYRQTLARAETTIHRKDERKDMWPRHLHAERRQSHSLRATIRELRNKSTPPSVLGLKGAGVYGLCLHRSARR